MIFLYTFTLFFIFNSGDTICASGGDKQTEEPLVSSRSTLPVFLEPLEKAPKKDPPFFKMVSTAGNNIYVLGSIHNYHSDILLSNNVKNSIKEISSQCVYFKEHSSFHEYLTKKITANQYKAEVSYTDTASLPVNKGLEERWDLICSHKIFSPELKKYRFYGKLVISTQKEDALMMIYLEGLNKFVDLFGEFEASLEVLPWHGEKKYLEECERGLHRISKGFGNDKKAI